MNLFYSPFQRKFCNCSHPVSIFTICWVSLMNFIWCVLYFRKTVQLHWTRFKKGPLLPEADISGKKKKKKKKEYCQVLFLHCCGIRCRQVYAFYWLQKEKRFRVQSEFWSKYQLRVFLPYQIFQTIGSKENIIRTTIFFHVNFRLKKKNTYYRCNWSLLLNTGHPLGGFSLLNVRYSVYHANAHFDTSGAYSPTICEIRLCQLYMHDIMQHVSWCSLLWERGHCGHDPGTRSVWAWPG